MYEHILVGTDGSATAAKAVDRAVEMAKATGAVLTILSVGTGAEDVVAREAARVKESGVKVKKVASTGDPASVLLDEAERTKADLVVVGNKGMSGASRFLLGSVPNKVSHHAPCALLIVHTT